MTRLEGLESWLSGGLPSSVEMESESCSRSFEAFARSAWAHAESDTPLLLESPHKVICDHVQELLHGFVRVRLYHLAQSHAFNQLPRVSTARLPLGRKDQEVELRERARLASLWATGQRLGVMLKDGRVEERPQLYTALLISMGTGMGKSRFVSVLAPAYLWLLWPSAAEQAFSVNPRSVARDAGLQLKILRSPWFRNTFRCWWDLDAKRDAEANYRNTAGGMRMAMGWNAKAVGDRSHLQIIDDPEDPQKVYSDGERASTKLGWDTRISRRVVAGGTSIRLGTQARLLGDDWSSHVLKSGFWEHLEFATVAEATPSPCQCPTHKRGHTRLGWRDTRAPGELLAPRLVPEKDVEMRRASPVIFAAQDQQRPKDLVGNIFPPEKWHFWRFADEDAVPEFAARTFVLPVEREQWDSYFEAAVLSGDLSFGGQGDGSRDCIGIWGQRGVRKLLLDVEWEALSFTEAQRAVRRLTEKYPWVDDRRIELAANGGAVIDSLTEGVERESEEPGAVEYLEQPIDGLVPVRPEGSKIYRAISISPEHEAGNLFLPLHHPKLQEMLAESGAFPRKGKGIRNDFVDMTSQAIRRLKARARQTEAVRSLYQPPRF